ncbi:MAG: hypothetical protein JKY52_13975 [Flavobacteriales bacterium]|nr:hypothetical protein [Flavobacteriales bacterium]
MVLLPTVVGTGNTIESLVLEVTTVLIYLACTYYFARVLLWPVEQVWYKELIKLYQSAGFLNTKAMTVCDNV